MPHKPLSKKSTVCLRESISEESSASVSSASSTSSSSSSSFSSRDHHVKDADLLLSLAETAKGQAAREPVTPSPMERSDTPEGLTVTTTMPQQQESPPELPPPPNDDWIRSPPSTVSKKKNDLFQPDAEVAAAAAVRHYPPHPHAYYMMWHMPPSPWYHPHAPPPGYRHPPPYASPPPGDSATSTISNGTHRGTEGSSGTPKRSPSEYSRDMMDHGSNLKRQRMVGRPSPMQEHVKRDEMKGENEYHGAVDADHHATISNNSDGEEIKTEHQNGIQERQPVISPASSNEGQGGVDEEIQKQTGSTPPSNMHPPPSMPGYPPFVYGHPPLPPVPYGYPYPPFPPYHYGMMPPPGYYPPPPQHQRSAATHAGSSGTSISTSQKRAFSPVEPTTYSQSVVDIKKRAKESSEAPTEPDDKGDDIGQELERMESGTSVNRCIPIKRPLPRRWDTLDLEAAQNAKLPEFSTIVNYPDYLSRGRFGERNPTGQRPCVMCGKVRVCSATSLRRGDETQHIIPRQNKGVCTECDVSVWLIVDLEREIKWCKGCKNFRPWAAFGEKGMATKCVRCRTRQKEKYAASKGDTNTCTTTSTATDAATLLDLKVNES